MGELSNGESLEKQINNIWSDNILIGCKWKCIQIWGDLSKSSERRRLRGDTAILLVARHDVVSSSAHACQSPATFSLVLHPLESSHSCPILHPGDFYQPMVFLTTVIKRHFLSSLSSLWEKECCVVPWWNASIVPATVENKVGTPEQGCEAARVVRTGWRAGECFTAHCSQLVSLRGKTWRCAPSSQQLFISEIQGWNPICRLFLHILFPKCHIF